MILTKKSSETETQCIVCQYCCMGSRQQGPMKYHLVFKNKNEKERYQKQKP